MVALPETTSPTVDAIYAQYEKSRQLSRHYLGASLIGNECLRALWYAFRWAHDAFLEGRKLRLFETGQREEQRVYENLRAIGVKVIDVDPRTKSQMGFTDHGGHFCGHCDGAILGVIDAPKTWHLLEIKTHGEKSFNALKKHGVAASKPEHVAQMQTYMGYMELTRALYFAVNKNTDELHAERLHFDEPTFQAIKDKARRVIESESPCDPCSSNVKTPPCVYCDYRSLCYEGRVANVNCRTCAHSTPIVDGDGGEWRCELREPPISREIQRAGCGEHLFIPQLIPYAEPYDSGDGWVAYKMREREQCFVNCASTGFPKDIKGPYFSSSEICAIAPENIGDGMVEELRKQFEAKAC